MAGGVHGWERSSRCFGVAAAGFADVVSSVAPHQWDQPGLGVWSVRDLAGHASRALLTVESYLDAAAAADSPTVLAPADYYLAAASALADPEAVAERGRRSGAALGDDPATAVREMAERVTGRVSTANGQERVATPVGVMTLATYLPTRVFELTVHTLDLAHAVELEPPSGFGDPVAASVVLAAELSIVTGEAEVALLALTGRRALPTGFSVV